MDDALLVRVLDASQSCANSVSRPRRSMSRLSQYAVIGSPLTYSIAKYGRPWAVVPAKHLCDRWMVHERERLTLRFETR